MTQPNPFAVPFGVSPPPSDPSGAKPRWRHRFGAAFLDLFALSLLGSVVTGVVALLTAPAPQGVREALAVLGLLLSVGVAVAWYARQGRTGGTYGKDLVGLRLLDVRTGEPIGTFPGVLRPVAHLADTVFLVGFLRPLWHPQGKTFADSMQRSVVTRSAPRPTPLGTGPLRLLSVVAVLLYVALSGAALRVSHVRDQPTETQAAPAGQAAASPRAPTATTATPTPPPPPTRLASADLEGRFLTPPADFERQSDTRTMLGTLDAAGVIRVAGITGDEAADGAAGLRLLGFRRAVAHQWVGDGAALVVLVYEFKDSRGAARIVEATDEPGTFRSRTVPAATAYTDAAGGLSRQHGLFASGNHVFEIAVVTPEPEADHARFDQLLKTQRDRAAATS